MNCLKCKKTIAPVKNLEPGLSSAGKDTPNYTLSAMTNSLFVLIAAQKTVSLCQPIMVFLRSRLVTCFHDS